MDQVVVVGVDGSEDSVRAAATALPLLAPAHRTYVATVVDGADPSLVTGASGMAAGTVSPAQYEELLGARQAEGQEIVDRAIADLGLSDAEAVVVAGDPGVELILLVREVAATVLVVGSRGRGGLKRALLGSVSDHLVRYAPCPVLVVRDDVEDAEAD